MAAFRNRHKGETAVVVANGPSLKETPLEFLYNYPSFASNYISLFEGFIPTYLTVIDPEAIGRLDEDKQEVVDVQEDRMSLIEPLVPSVENFFVIHTAKKLFKSYKNVQPIYNTMAANWSYSPIRYLFTGGTATYTNLQLAFYFGFQRVIIVGLDHDYSDGHFDESYIKSQKVIGDENQKDSLNMMEASYGMAQRVYDIHERIIVNCSVYSRSKVFARARPPWRLTGEYDAEDPLFLRSLELISEEEALERI